MAKEDKKKVWAQIRLSENEKEILTKKAAELGLSLSAYIRMTLVYKSKNEEKKEK